MSMPVNISSFSLGGIMLKSSVYGLSNVVKFSWLSRFGGPITRPVVYYKFCLHRCTLISVAYIRLAPMIPVVFRW